MLRLSGFVLPGFGKPQEFSYICLFALPIGIGELEFAGNLARVAHLRSAKLYNRKLLLKVAVVPSNFVTLLGRVTNVPSFSPRALVTQS